MHFIALRGEAAMKARLPKEAKRSASISPYEKAIAGSPSPASFHSEVEEEDLTCVGDLLQLTQKGNSFSQLLIFIGEQ